MLSFRNLRVPPANSALRNGSFRILLRKTTFGVSMVKAFLLCKNGLRPPPFLGGAHKGLSETFIKTQLHCVFRNKIISFVIKIYFFKNFAQKINFALLLNRKSCICYRKHCRAYFRRHMECAVLKRFLKVQETFSIKKFLQIPLFHSGKIKFNPFY